MKFTAVNVALTLKKNIYKKKQPIQDFIVFYPNCVTMSGCMINVPSFPICAIIWSKVQNCVLNGVVGRMLSYRKGVSGCCCCFRRFARVFCATFVIVLVLSWVRFL